VKYGPHGLPLCLVAFAQENNPRITVVEVESAVPEVTGVPNAIERYPELAAQASSIYLLPTPKTVIKIVNGRRVD
jgi:hypothetical protein